MSWVSIVAGLIKLMNFITGRIDEAELRKDERDAMDLAERRRQDDIEARYRASGGDASAGGVFDKYRDYLKLPKRGPSE